MSTILVIDDDPSITDVIAEIVREERYTIATAHMDLKD